MASKNDLKTNVLIVFHVRAPENGVVTQRGVQVPGVWCSNENFISVL